MSLKAGTYSLGGSSGNLHVYTFKEGLLSKLAHDLLIDVTNFKVNLDVPEAGFTSGSLELEIQANSLKVICALKDGERSDALKEKDIADIEKDMAGKVLHPDKYPTANFRSKAMLGTLRIKNEINIGFDLSLNCT